MPREATSENTEWEVVSIGMDVCKTPSGSGTPPVPYIITAPANVCNDVAKGVYLCGEKTFVLRSIIQTCYGDESGTAGGVRSGVNQGCCYAITYSSVVNIEKSPLVREHDLFGMNSPEHGGPMNTIGILKRKVKALAYNAVGATLEATVAVMKEVDETVKPYLKETEAGLDKSIESMKKAAEDASNTSWDKISSGLTYDQLSQVGEGAAKSFNDAMAGITDLPSDLWNAPIDTIGKVGTGVVTGTTDAISKLISGVATGQPGSAIGEVGVDVIAGRAVKGVSSKVIGSKSLAQKAEAATSKADAAKSKLTASKETQSRAHGEYNRVTKVAKNAKKRRGAKRKAKSQAREEMKRADNAVAENELASSNATAAAEKATSQNNAVNNFIDDNVELLQIPKKEVQPPTIVP